MKRRMRRKKKVLAFLLAMTMSTWFVNIPMNQVHAEEMPRDEISEEAAQDLYEAGENSGAAIPEEPQFPEEPNGPETTEVPKNDPETTEVPKFDQVQPEEELKEQQAQIQETTKLDQVTESIQAMEEPETTEKASDANAEYVKLKNISVESGKDINGIQTPDNFVAKVEMDIPETLRGYSLILSYWNETARKDYEFKSEMGMAGDMREVKIDLHKYYPKGTYILRSVRMDGMACSAGANVIGIDYENAAFYEVENKNCLFMNQGEQKHEVPYNGELDFTITDSPALEDTSAPEITSIKLVSGKEIGTHSKAEFQLDYLEEGSGISKAWIRVQDDNENTFEFEARADHAEQWTGKGTISITSNFLSKSRYKVVRVWVEDYVGNHMSYYRKEAGDTILSGNNPEGEECLLDVTACTFEVVPLQVLKSLKFAGNVKKDQAAAGDSFEIKAVIYNPAAENALISPETSNIKWSTGKYTKGSGETFILRPGEEAEIVFPVTVNPFADKGSRQIENVSISEQSCVITFERAGDCLTADREGVINEWLGNKIADLAYAGEADYTVTKADTPDQDAPYIESISIVTKNIKAPGKVSFEIKASEGQAKMTSFLPVFIDTANPDNTLVHISKGALKNKFESELIYSKEKKCYVYTIDLPVSAIKGEYILDNFSVYDEAGNSRYYKIKNGELADTENEKNKCGACKMVIAEAESSDHDFTEPILKGFELVDHEVRAGDKLQIKIKAEEESGISLVTVRWMNSKWETISFDSTEIVPAGDGYLCTFITDQYCREGDYIPYDVMLMDGSVRANLSYFSYNDETSSFSGPSDISVSVTGSANLKVIQAENTVVLDRNADNEKEVLDTVAQGGTVIIKSQEGLTGSILPTALSTDLLNKAREKGLTIVIHTGKIDLVIDGKSIPDTITEPILFKIMRKPMTEEPISVGGMTDNIYYPVEIAASNTDLSIAVRVKVDKEFIKKCGNKGIRFSGKNPDGSVTVIAKDLAADEREYVEVRLSKGWNMPSGQSRAIQSENLQFIISAAYEGYQLGDINNDKKVNLIDLMMCLNHVAKKTELTGDALRAADIDGKGGVTLSDLMRILNYVSKKTDKL